MKEWQRQNFSQDQQVRAAIAFVVRSIPKLQRLGSDRDLVIFIDYPEPVVRHVQEHFKDVSNLKIGQSAKFKRQMRSRLSTTLPTREWGL